MTTPTPYPPSTVKLASTVYLRGGWYVTINGHTQTDACYTTQTEARKAANTARRKMTQRMKGGPL